AHRQMGMNTVNTGKAMEKLSSGLRINRAGDDAAGLAISEKMRGQIRGLDQASRNSQDGISLIQTAEGALNETHSILQRMRELAVQASNDTNTKDDRGQLQKEINQLTSEVNRIANTTEFNTQKILNSEKGKNFELQIGANEGQSMTVKMDDMTSKALKITDDTNKKYVSDKNITDLTIATKDAAGAAPSKLEIEVAGQKFTLAEIPAKTKASISVSKDEIISKINNQLEKNNVALTASIEDGKLALSGTNATEALKTIKISGATDAAGTAASPDFGKTAEAGFANEITNGTDNTAISSALDVSTHKNAAEAITKFDNALNKVSDQRSRLGAYQNRLEHTINNLNTSSENLQASESRIRDVDMAKEMMNFSKNNILAQAAQAMLAQA
ncbi:flagellin, partial [Clostridium botulinum]|nr:flagellin [Clostridium botulinum]NFL04204.1 flagellin [Clostridium botulinum]